MHTVYEYLDEDGMAEAYVTLAALSQKKSRHSALKHTNQ